MTIFSILIIMLISSIPLILMYVIHAIAPLWLFTIVFTIVYGFISGFKIKRFIIIDSIAFMIQPIVSVILFNADKTSYFTHILTLILLKIIFELLSFFLFGKGR